MRRERRKTVGFSKMIRGSKPTGESPHFENEIKAEEIVQLRREVEAQRAALGVVERYR